MSSNEGYLLALEQAKITKPVTDETPPQGELWQKTNKHLYLNNEGEPEDVHCT